MSKIDLSELDSRLEGTTRKAVDLNEADRFDFYLFIYFIYLLNVLVEAFGAYYCSTVVQVKLSVCHRRLALLLCHEASLTSCPEMNGPPGMTGPARQRPEL